MEYTFKKLVASLAAKQLSEDMLDIKTKGTMHLRVKSTTLPLLITNRNEKLSQEETERLFKIRIEAVAARRAAQAQFLEQGQRVAALLGLLRWRPRLGRGAQGAGIGHGRLAGRGALRTAAAATARRRSGRLGHLLVRQQWRELAEVLQHAVVEGAGHLEVLGFGRLLRGLGRLGRSYQLSGLGCPAGSIARNVLIGGR